MRFLSDEQQALLLLTARSFGSATDAGLDFAALCSESLLEEASQQTVLLAAFEQLSPYKSKILEETYKRWLKRASRISQKNFIVAHSQKSLVDLLDEKGIDYTIIKGTAAAAYYDDPNARALGDIDFLVRREDLLRTKEALLADGYEADNTEEEHDCHVVFYKAGVQYELHFETSGIPYGDTGEKIRAFLADAPSKAPLTKEGFRAPLPVHHGLILLLHMQHHMLGEGLGLRHLCDWAAFVKKTDGSAFWTEELLPFLQEIGLYRYAQVMTRTCAKYFRFSAPSWAEAEEELCDDVMADILQGGNFGNKDEIRSKSGMLISRHGKNGTKDGAGKNLLSVLHDSVMKKYPVIKKFPPVYPFLFLWRALRYGVLMLFGRRHSIAKMLPEAEKRKNIYRRLKVFETEKGEKR